MIATNTAELLEVYDFVRKFHPDCAIIKDLEKDLRKNLAFYFSWGWIFFLRKSDGLRGVLIGWPISKIEETPKFDPDGSIFFVKYCFTLPRYRNQKVIIDYARSVLEVYPHINSIAFFRNTVSWNEEKKVFERTGASKLHFKLMRQKKTADEKPEEVA